MAVEIESILLCAIGIAIGASLAVLLAAQFEEQLFHVSPSDLGALTTTALLIIAVAIVATAVPCRIIARTDPASSLKSM